jgi:hypothetical protein
MTKVWVAPCPVCKDFTLWADKTVVDSHASTIFGCLFCGNWKYPPDVEPNTPATNTPPMPVTPHGEAVTI